MTPRRLALETILGLALTAALCAFFWSIFSQLDSGHGWSKVVEYRRSLWLGWWATLQLSAGSLVGSCLVAVALLAGQRSGLKTLKWFCRGIIELVRAMPLLSLILIGYYVVLARAEVRDALDTVGLGGKLFAGIVLLSLFTGAYLSEIMRGGLDSIPRAQLDSARAVGFDRWQVQRYIVMPQALRRVLPAVAGQFVSLVKDSSLLMVIGVSEFTYEARSFASATYVGLVAYMPLAVGYLALTLPIAAFSSWLERRFRAETAS